jgi:hypothetical protein
VTLLLTFSASDSAVATLGPRPRFLFDGEVIRAAPGGEPLATHSEHAWQIRGQRYVRLDCNAPVRVHFLAADGSSSIMLGPFVHLSCVDGVCYVDREVFAVVDRAASDWYSIVTERHWPTMVLAPAA